MRARLDRIFTIRTPLPGSRCFEMYSNRDWEMGNVEGRTACVVQYSCLCQYEFVYSNVEYLSTYTKVLGNTIK